MKLKGNYSSDESYSIGDIVVYEGEVFIKYLDGIASTPKDTHAWNRLEQPLCDVVLMITDALGLAKDEVEKYFLNDHTLLLKAGEGESETTYAITVDDSGDTPELAVEEVTDEGGES